MFTGIITAVGDVVEVERRNGLMRLTMESPYDPAGVAIGASICHDGCCLTVVETASVKGGMRHVVEVARESLDITTLGSSAWDRKSTLNALCARATNSAAISSAAMWTASAAWRTFAPMVKAGAFPLTRRKRSRR